MMAWLWATAFAATAIVADRPPAGGFVALGDSYTVGEGLTPEQSWPFQLAALLRAHYRWPDSEFSPQVLAQTGWTTDELAGALSKATSNTGSIQSCYRLVTVSVGVNDQYRGRPVAQFEADYSALLESAIALADNDPQRVLVLSIPDWGQSPFALARGANRRQISANIDHYNGQKRRLTEAYKASFIDITRATRMARPSDYAADGLHPGAAIYAQWAKLVQSPAQQILNRPNPCQPKP